MSGLIETNHQIGAGIIGYIRQAALGEALLPFEQRVYEVVLDAPFINELPAFQGEVKQLNKVLDNQLNTILDEVKVHLWEAS